MRVSIVNFVSTALQMLSFSTEAIFANAGTDDFDYLVVTWLPSQKVSRYLDSQPEIIQIPYKTNDSVGYVPNIRGMFNLGFDSGFERNPFCGIVNTDMYFGKNWLKNLVKYATEETIVNSVHITRIRGPHVVTADLGIPTRQTFDLTRFERLYGELCKDRLETEEERDGWLATNTLPYIFHRKWWEKCGPWELRMVDNETPDRRFFQRCHDAGARFTMSHGSVVYHHEAGERLSARPPWAGDFAQER